MKRSIAIGGFMGVGKTTVGAKLAARYGCDFVDLDREIENQCGMTIGQYFEQFGEAKFRDLETECLQRALQAEPVVLALGGGTLHFGLNCGLIQSSTQLFCLGLPLPDIRRRLGAQDDDRPLWRKAESLYEERLPLYRTAGTYLDVQGKSVGEIVDYLYEASICA